MRKLLYVILIAALAVFGLTFSAKNHQMVAIDYYFGLRFETELALLLLAVLAIGLLLGYLAALPGTFSARRKRRRAQRESERAHAQAQRAHDDARALPNAAAGTAQAQQ